MLLKIGELAKRTGLTVRTLHHYDDIKLLCPSARSDAGYRLYNRKDIERLHRIQALRRMDLSLAEIGALLENDGAGLQQVIEQQIALLDRQAAKTIELRDRLKALLERVAHNEEPDLPDWLVTLEMMAMYDKYFTSEEVAKLREIKAQENRTEITESMALIADIRALMDSRVPPESEETQALSIPWMALADRRMDGDARLIRKVDRMHRYEPVAQALTGVDGAMIDYMARASLTYRVSIYGKYLSEDELRSMPERFMAHRLRIMDLTSELAEMVARGGDPRSAEGQELSARWFELSVDLWGRDPEVHMKVRAAHLNEPYLLVGTGFNRDMLDFLHAGIGWLVEQRRMNGLEIL
ncbi:MAG TPA: MerR family transcriptional regulator [Noviherbaspirillum sp.]|nr:MerR family transcriptional regulator [Noviherbaspirillum sp.]